MQPGGLECRKSDPRFGMTMTPTKDRGNEWARAVICVKTKCCLFALTTPADGKLQKATTSSWSGRLMPPFMPAKLFSNHGSIFALRTPLVSVSCSAPDEKAKSFEHFGDLKVWGSNFFAFQTEHAKLFLDLAQSCLPMHFPFALRLGCCTRCARCPQWTRSLASMQLHAFSDRGQHWNKTLGLYFK